MRTLLICALAMTHAACSPTSCKDNSVFLSYALTNGAEAADTLDVALAIGSDAAQTRTVVRKTSGAPSGSIEVDFGAYPTGKALALTLIARAGDVVLASASQTTTATPGCTTLSLALDGSTTTSVDMAEPAPDLTKLLAKGESCSLSSGPPCAAGLVCVDGVCCDGPCTGQCQACNLEGKNGTCSAVTSGQPRGSRTACAGTGSTCAGSCAGNPSACDYPPSGTVCGAACDGTCDSAGTCSSSGGGSCPNGFACGASTCRTSCSDSTHCQPNFMCSAPNCVRVPESDCLDGMDNNGDGLKDCEDPSCNDRVQCVPEVAGGNEIGLFQSVDCPSSNFTVASVQNQNLQAQPCGGCTCSVRTECSTQGTCRPTDCSSGNPSTCYVLSATNQGPGACVMTNPNYLTVEFGSFTHVLSECISAGAASAPTPSWGTTKNFCGAARQSSTCGAAKVCIAKPPVPTTMCVRVPSASSSCPAGYPNLQGNWYTSYTPAQCSCGACTKNSNGSCPMGADFTTQVAYFNTLDLCMSGMSPAVVYDNPDTGVCSVPGFYASNYARIMGPLNNMTTGTCTRPTNTDQAATPTGPSTICCQ